MDSEVQAPVNCSAAAPHAETFHQYIENFIFNFVTKFDSSSNKKFYKGNFQEMLQFYMQIISGVACSFVYVISGKHLI